MPYIYKILARRSTTRLFSREWNDILLCAFRTQVLRYTLHKRVTNSASDGLFIRRLVVHRLVQWKYEVGEQTIKAQSTPKALPAPG